MLFVFFSHVFYARGMVKVPAAKQARLSFRSDRPILELSFPPRWRKPCFILTGTRKFSSKRALRFHWQGAVLWTARVALRRGRFFRGDFSSNRNG